MMFKGRIWIWIVVVVVCFIIHMFSIWIPIWSHTDEMTLTADVSTDNDLAEGLSNTTIDRIHCNIVSDEADIVISDNDALMIEGYTKYEDALYSPIVLYACNVGSYSNGFAQVGGSYSCYKIDLLKIIEALEAGDKTWQDVGLHTNVADGPVTLYIPGEASGYYDAVVELFYLTVNGGQVPDDAKKTELEPRVTAILDKCTKVNDVMQIMSDDYQASSVSHKIVIGPEYLYSRGGNCVGSGSSNQYRIVYLLHTTYLNADIHVKNFSDADNQISERFFELMKADNYFMRKSGWRIENSTFNVNTISSTHSVSP